MPSPTPAHRAAGPKPTTLQATLFLVEPNHDLVAEEPARTIEAVLSRTTHSTLHAHDSGARAPTLVLRSPREDRDWNQLYRLAQMLLSRLAAQRDLMLVLVASSEVSPWFRAALFTVVGDLLVTCGQRLSISVRFPDPHLLSPQ
jgi:hypothetical protein